MDDKPPVLARGEADRAAEVPMQVALVGEARPRGGFKLDLATEQAQ